MINDSISGSYGPLPTVSGERRKFVAGVIQRCNRELAAGSLDGKRAEAIGQLFFGVLATWSEGEFDRALIGKGSLLEKELSRQAEARGLGNFVKLREKAEQLQRGAADIGTLSARARTEQVTRVGEAVLDAAYAEAQVALALGVQPRAAGDTSTSFQLRDLSGKSIALFKPDDMGPRGPRNPKVRGVLNRVVIWVKSIFSPHIRQARQHIHEELNYRVSRHLGALNVPPTRVVSIVSPLIATARKQGSFQLFIHGAKEAEEVLQARTLSKPLQLLDSFVDFISSCVDRVMGKKRELMAASPRQRSAIGKKAEAEKIVRANLLTSLAALDFVTGQIDRKFANWMIVKSDPKPEQGRLFIDPALLIRGVKEGVGIVAIDGGASFPKSAEEQVEAANQYLWAEMLQEDHYLDGNQLNLGWQEKVEEELLECHLALDLPRLGERELKPFKELLSQVIDPYINHKKNGRLRARPSLHELREKIAKKKLLPLSQKELQALAKTAQQLLMLRERVAIFECFLVPRELQEERGLTIQRLAGIRTPKEIAAFWQWYDRERL